MHNAASLGVCRLAGALQLPSRCGLDRGMGAIHWHKIHVNFRNPVAENWFPAFRLSNFLGF